MTLTPDDAETGPARIRPIRAGLLCRCPKCGQGRLYDGFLKVCDRCEVCDMDMTRLNTGDGPAVFIMQIAGFFVVFTALFVEIAYRPPIWLHLALWPPLAGLLALGLMRPLKGVMIAIQIKARAGEFRHDAS